MMDTMGVAAGRRRRPAAAPLPVMLFDGGGITSTATVPGGGYDLVAAGTGFRFDPHQIQQLQIEAEAQQQAAAAAAALLGGGGGGSFKRPRTSPQQTVSNLSLPLPLPGLPLPLPHQASSSSLSPSPLQWLDERIWSRLPQRILDRILAMLPLPSFLRLRAVCKRWYELVFSDSFLELCREFGRLRPWFLFFRQGDWSRGFLYDPESGSWYPLPMPGFSTVATSTAALHRQQQQQQQQQLAIVSSSGGLLCCMNLTAGLKTVIVCNPITRAFVQLPTTFKERFVPTVGLVADAGSRSYKLVAAGDDLISPFAVKNLTTEVYDSLNQRWRMAGPLPRLCNLESAKTTFANGLFYCMNYSPFSVLAYDDCSGGWSKIQAPMRRFLRTPNLVECRGRLVMVAAVEKNRLNVPKSIRIWGLQHPKNTWAELERMPQELYEEFMRVSNEKAFYCVGHGNLILITTEDSPDILAYDFYEKLWHWLPRCPFVADNEGGLQGFAFEPRLEASVC